MGGRWGISTFPLLGGIFYICVYTCRSSLFGPWNRANWTYPNNHDVCPYTRSATVTSTIGAKPMAWSHHNDMSSVASDRSPTAIDATLHTIGGGYRISHAARRDIPTTYTETKAARFGSTSATYLGDPALLLPWTDPRPFVRLAPIYIRWDMVAIREEWRSQIVSRVLHH
jgi:hypothetical protein